MFWPLVGLLASAAVAIWAFANSADLVPFLAGSSSALIFLFSYWLIRVERRARKAAMRDPNPTLKILTSRRTCVVHSPKRIDYSYDFKVRAKQNGVHMFNLAFSWTGTGQLEFRSRNSRLHHQFVDVRSSSSTMLHVIFEKPLTRGEVLEFGFEMITEGSMKPQRPFFAETIFRHTPKHGRASIGVEFAKDVAIQALWMEEYVDQAAHWPHKQEQVTVPADGKFEWSLRAATGRRCCISWEYAR